MLIALFDGHVSRAYDNRVESNVYPVSQMQAEI